MPCSSSHEEHLLLHIIQVKCANWMDRPVRMIAPIHKNWINCTVFAITLSKGFWNHIQVQWLLLIHSNAIKCKYICTLPPPLFTGQMCLAHAVDGTYPPSLYNQDCATPRGFYQPSCLRGWKICLSLQHTRARARPRRAAHWQNGYTQTWISGCWDGDAVALTWNSRV